MPMSEHSPIGRMLLSLGGTFIGIPAAFVFLAIAGYGTGGPRFWVLGALSLLFGLWSLWAFFGGSGSRSGEHD